MRLAMGLARAEDGVIRCAWPGADSLYRRYHDREWGRPVRDEARLFEKLCLEGFQAGLSWLTILRKREAFREAFAGFDPERVARFGARDEARLLRNGGIVRHRGKIASAIGNARRCLELRAEGGLAALVWSFEPSAAERPRHVTHARLLAMTTTSASVALSRALKERRWTFVGPTTMYALMEAVGVVNDHLEGCDAREACERARASFRRPRRPAVAE